MCALSVGCSSEREPATGASAASTNDTTRFEVTWKPSTVLIDAAVVSTRWLASESEPARGLYRFRNDEGLARVREGEIVLFPGVALVKVISTSVDGETLTVQGEPASMLDAASEGDIAWDIDASGHADAIALVPKPTGGVKTQNLALREEAHEVNFSGSHEDKSFGVKLSRQPGERPNIAFEMFGAVESSTQAGVTSVGTGVRAEVKGRFAFRSAGAFRFADGKLLHFSFELRDVDLHAEGTLSANAILVIGVKPVDYEARLIVPFPVGPVPFYCALGAAVNLNAKVGTEDTIHANATFDYQGDVGFEADGLSVTRVVRTSEPVITGDWTGQPRVFASAIATLAAPRVELGVGVPTLGAEAGVFLDLRASQGIYADVAPDSLCVRGGAGFAVTAGARAKFFGLSFESEKELAKFGNGETRAGICD